jgi:hypothetical protein
MDVVFGLLLYISPVVVLPFVVRQDRLLRRVAVITCLCGSFIGELSFLLASRRYDYSSLVDSRFWRFLVVFYPVAIFSLGLWTVLLGVLGCRLAKILSARRSLGSVGLYVIGVLFGAAAGAIFMTCFVGIAIVFGIMPYPRDGFAAYLITGFITGAAIGPICVNFALRLNVTS